MVDLASLRDGGGAHGDPSTGLKVKNHDLRIAHLPLRAGPHAGAVVAVRERDAADLGEARHTPGRFWTTLVGKSSQQISYILAWDGMAEREKRWGALLADPEWVAVAAKTEKDGQLVENISSQLLAPTTFSVVK
jgi:NIPSNAP